MALSVDSVIVYLVLGGLWVACTAWTLVMGFSDEVGPAVAVGFIMTLILALPVAFLAALLWRMMEVLWDCAQWIRSRWNAALPLKGGIGKNAP